MLGLLIRLLEGVVVGACILSLSQLFLALAMMPRLLPGLLRFLRSGLRGLLILSFRFYRLILTQLHPLTQRLGINVLTGSSRLAATILLSLGLGLSFLLLADLSLTAWAIGFSLLHGVFVGLAWDEIEKPGGLQLGVRIQ